MLAGTPDIVRVHVRGNLLYQLPGFTQDKAVHHMLRIVLHLCRISRAFVGSIRIESEEVIDVPQRKHHLSYPFTNPLLGHNQVAAAQNRR